MMLPIRLRLRCVALPLKESHPLGPELKFSKPLLPDDFVHTPPRGNVDTEISFKDFYLLHYFFLIIILKVYH